MLFISEITKSVLKMVYIGLMTHLQRHPKFFDKLRHMAETFLKRILTYFYFTKYNEISLRHSDVQKHVSYTGSRKRFLIYYNYGLCLETAECVF